MNVDLLMDAAVFLIEAGLALKSENVVDRYYAKFCRVKNDQNLLPE